MRSQYYGLLFLFGLLTISLLLFKQLPYLISRADRIDPNNLHESYDPGAKYAVFNNQSLALSPNPNPPEIPQVLGDTSTHKRIEVDLTNQRVYAFEDNQQKFDFSISSGTWNRTPTGTFQIWTKIRSQKMSGGSKELGTYYYLPNVPYILFFYNNQNPKSMGFSLHGTYWHNNFGTPMSHGCINMKTSEVAQIYPWAEVGTPVIIYGKYQKLAAKTK